MKITIQLPSFVEDRLMRRAALEGKTVEALAIELIEQALEHEQQLNEILGRAAQPTIVVAAARAE